LVPTAFDIGRVDLQIKLGKVALTKLAAIARARTPLSVVNEPYRDQVIRAWLKNWEKRTAGAQSTATSSTSSMGSLIDPMRSIR